MSINIYSLHDEYIALGILSYLSIYLIYLNSVETGGCPHAAIREDISANLHACEVLTASFTPLDIILLESGGDNLAANFSPELADLTLYVIDVAGGDKVPRKGGPGVTQSDILIINKVCVILKSYFVSILFPVTQKT